MNTSAYHQLSMAENKGEKERMRLHTGYSMDTLGVQLGSVCRKCAAMMILL